MGVSTSPKHPLHRRTVTLAISASLLYWTATSSTWAAYTELFLERACADHGLSGDDCAEGHPLYDAVQHEASTTLTWFLIATGVPAWLTCSATGVLGDSFGRKPALLLPALGGLIYSVATLLLPASAQWSALLPLAVLSFACGGYYSFQGVTFATIADVTEAESAAVRTRLFGLAEGSCWVGYAIGPTLGGICVQCFGVQRSFALSSLLYAATVLLLLTCYEETLPSRQRFAWSRANPIGGVWLLTTNPTALGMSTVVFATLVATASGITLIPLFTEAALDLSPLHIGWVQSVFFASNAFGLLVLLPRALRLTSPKTIVALAAAWNALFWAAWALAVTEWQVFLVAALAFPSAMCFPPVRATIAEAFGPAQHGASLAALGTVQQMTQVAAPTIFSQVWAAMLGGKPVGAPYLVVGACGAVAALAALLTPVAAARGGGDGASGEGGGGGVAGTDREAALLAAEEAVAPAQQDER